MNNKQVSFKPYKQGESYLFPPNLGDLIPEDHPVRLINYMVDKLDISEILATYKPGGTSCYHPRMLMKLLVYGYFDQVTSSRKLENNTRENICYMWLCGMNTPTYVTISTFRSGKLKGKVKQLFGSILKEIYEQEQLTLGTQYIDGTIFESVANKNTSVWAKNTKRFKENTAAKIKAILADVEGYLKADHEEGSCDNQQKNQPVKDDQAPTHHERENSQKHSPQGSKIDASSEADSKEEEEDITSALVKKKIDEYSEITDKTIAKKVRKLEKELLQNLRKYEEQEQILDGRNSYSKTDPDATFMRMKEDRLGKGVPKPAYNVQISSHDQYILNYTLHQNPNDATCYIEHLQDTLDLFSNNNLPKITESVGDAIYGTEQNYEFIDNQEIDNYLKYPTFNRDLKKKVNAQNQFSSDTLFYNEEEDFYVCPMGQRMYKVKQETGYRLSGYKVTVDVYENNRCQNCPLQGVCHKKSGVRQVKRNKKLEAYRRQAYKNLTTEKGQKLRRQRSVDVEPIFGHIKYNRKWNRFTMVGLQKIEIELGLQCIAHNLRKWAKIWMEKTILTFIWPVKLHLFPQYTIIQKSHLRKIHLPQAPQRIAA